MNILKFLGFRRAPRSGRRKEPSGGNLTLRESQAQGPFTACFSDWVAREANPHIYETLRASIGLIDSIVDKLVMLDGIVRVEGENEALVKEIEEWMRGVRVNDLQEGFQAFYSGMGNELYEQGHSIGTMQISAGKNTIESLRVLDSKGIHFKRGPEGLETWYRPPSPCGADRSSSANIERLLRNNFSSLSVGSLGYKRLDDASRIYAGCHVDADNPYGVSVMRSMEFPGKTVVTIENAIYRSWERFGDPSFHLAYKTNARIDDEALETRRKQLHDNLAEALKIKAEGNSSDFVTATGKLDDISVSILGADGQVLEPEQAVRHLEEQIIAKGGIPAWLLGRHWSTSERQAMRQGEILLQDSKTRWVLRVPGLTQVIATELRLRGRTWRPGDWQLVQELPNLQDLIALAQSRFMDAQAEAVGADEGPEGG